MSVRLVLGVVVYVFLLHCAWVFCLWVGVWLFSCLRLFVVVLVYVVLRDLCVCNRCVLLVLCVFVFTVVPFVFIVLFGIWLLAAFRWWMLLVDLEWIGVLWICVLVGIL